MGFNRCNFHLLDIHTIPPSLSSDGRACDVCQPRRHPEIGSTTVSVTCY
jgi:hypothetical protein